MANSQIRHSAVTAASGRLRFDAALALYFVATTLMAGAVSYSISKYFGWVFAVPMGIALTYTFSRLVKNIVAPSGVVSMTWRITCIFAALVVFATTMGFSYSSIYERLFAETSALDYFQKTRSPVQRQLESVVGHARTAAKAMEAWNAHSEDKARNEASGGGTCPAKAASLGRRGPIAMFREGEAAIAKDLNVTIDSAVGGVSAMLDAVKTQKPLDYKAVTRFTGELNAAIEAAETLAHGSLVKTAKASLDRQSVATIQWPNGEVFLCGDIARDELLKKAIASLEALEKAPSLSPLAPAVDLSNPQAVTNRGLLRSFNGEAMLLTAGAIGQFHDDPLMIEALKKGVINQETLGMLIAALLETLVLLSSMLVARRGAVPFPVDPIAIIDKLQVRAEATAGWLGYFWHATLNIAKGVFNLLWAIEPVVLVRGSAYAHNNPVTFNDPNYPERELDWAVNRLAPYMISLHDGDYVCIPAGSNARATMAARALTFNGAVGLMNTQVPWSEIAKNRAAAHHLQKLVPGAYGLSWEVYKLRPDFAQAVRIALLRA